MKRVWVILICLAIVVVFVVIGINMNFFKFAHKIDTEAGGFASELSDVALPGMPEGYELTKAQKDMKKELSKGGMPGSFKSMRPGVDYVEGEFVFMADDEAEAELIAGAYGGELADFNYGIAVGRLVEGSPYTLYDVMAAAANTKNNFPPVSLNRVYHEMGVMGE